MIGLGRIVVPKSIRDELGLTSGQEIEIQLRDTTIEVSVPPSPIHIEDRDGVVVAVPDGPVPALMQDAVRATLERIRRYVNTLDASVLIAAYASWHESHTPAVQAIGRRPTLISHAATEAHSMMTRLPEPSRAPADLVIDFLNRNFPPSGSRSAPDSTVRSCEHSLASA